MSMPVLRIDVAEAFFLMNYDDEKLLNFEQLTWSREHEVGCDRQVLGILNEDLVTNNHHDAPLINGIDPTKSRALLISASPPSQSWVTGWRLSGPPRAAVPPPPRLSIAKVDGAHRRTMAWYSPHHRTDV